VVDFYEQMCAKCHVTGISQTIQGPNFVRTLAPKTPQQTEGIFKGTRNPYTGGVLPASWGKPTELDRGQPEQDNDANPCRNSCTSTPPITGLDTGLSRTVRRNPANSRNLDAKPTPVAGNN
jgi:hypothetical protein